MSSMDWPFSSFFSISISSLIPSTIICTSSTSEKPSRSALEMSNTPPTAAVSTPPDGNEERKKKHMNIRRPRTWRVCSCWAASRGRRRAGRCPGWTGR
uniref:Uncharacterized protein n=1 Tax=Scophthalmus maximus TaxID=52904 RepID=A0A8D2ZYU0_SCOMX